jgi:hypothetical protein
VDKTPIVIWAFICTSLVVIFGMGFAYATDADKQRSIPACLSAGGRWVEYNIPLQDGGIRTDYGCERQK